MTKVHDGTFYNHPYNPYRIQIELMNEIYDTIENNYKIGIFESPTGTGKTLSIICSTMTWLREYKKKTVFDKPDISESESTDEEEPEWVNLAYNESVIRRSKSKIMDYELYLDKVKKDYELNRQDVENLSHLRTKKRKKEEKRDDEFLPDDFYSDSEKSTVDEKNTLLSKEIDLLLKKQNSINEDTVMDISCPIKIYYSSRTHSQLKQFSDQLTLTKFQSSFEGVEERTKYTPLGSRKQLCVNPKIKSIANESSINDACLEERNSKDGCEFLKKDKLNLTKKFSDLSLTKIHDIEELGEIGTSLKICPYYSIRESLELTEIISLPYQILLQDSTRDRLRLKIKNSIVVIDEAHNLLDVINSMNSVSINEEELKQITNALKVYLNKFLKRLNIGNRVNLMKLIKMCQLISTYIKKQATINIGEEISVSSIFGDTTGDLINIHKIENYLKKSKIAFKIESYMENVLEEKNQRKNSNPLLFKITKFLRCLNNPSKEGKFFWDKMNNVVSINYMLLDPSDVFKDIVDQAKCVLLCGGTMEPISDYTNYLFPYVPSSKIKSFSCDHIIPNENLKVFPITSYENHNFSFLYDKRDDPININSLGKLILQIVGKVPFGVVIFFPSYKYLKKVLDLWNSSRIYQTIEKTKKIFKEGETSSSVDTTLSEYSDTIQNQKKGALLLSVVGGKMSEGINFSDDLARAVIMVGLPFPNAYSANIIARRNFIESRSLEMGLTRKEASDNSRNYYENICMRSINQSIGRSIRHLNDYSIIYLIDQRYSQARIQQKLSGWVRKRLINDKSTNEILYQTEEFFNSKLVSKLQ